MDKQHLEPSVWPLATESILVRIRWFGVLMGYVLVHTRTGLNDPLAVRCILALGAGFALLDTLFHRHDRVFLERWPLFISAMEATFIGLLCYFDQGLASLFRFYYFLSLIVCAFRNSPMVTLATLGLHCASYGILASTQGSLTREQIQAVALEIVFLSWVTWASTALATLLKSASRKLFELNTELTENQALLEQRIAERTQELAAVAGSLGSTRKAGCVRTARSWDRPRGRQPADGDQLRELTSFSRPANQQQSVVDVHAAINDALNIAKYYKTWKGKSVTTAYVPGLPNIRTIYDQLVQVMLNLILNALDAMPEGAKMHISTEIIPPYGGLPERVGIRVRDEGHGISQEAQKQIFQPYFTTKAHGTGLGLFVCRQLTRQSLEGDIELVQSSPQGTEFLVTIAAKRADSSSVVSSVTLLNQP